MTFSWLLKKLKSNKSPGVDQIPAELIKAGGRTIRNEIHNLFLFGIRRNCLWSGMSRSFYSFTSMALKTGSNYRGFSLLPTM
jgi:hypothetical protein